MRHDLQSHRLATLTVLAAGLLLGGCSGVSMPSFNMPGFGGGSSDTPPPPSQAGAAIPSKYSSEEFVGRWGYTSYGREADKARTIKVAQGLCKNPYVIAKGPSGGLMMNLPDARELSELQLKGSPDGKNYIGPAGEVGVAEDREIVSFDGRVLIARFVDADAAKRYGNLVYVRCAARA